MDLDKAMLIACIIFQLQMFTICWLGYKVVFFAQCFTDNDQEYLLQEDGSPSVFKREKQFQALIHFIWRSGLKTGLCTSVECQSKSCKSL